MRHGRPPLGLRLVAVFLAIIHCASADLPCYKSNLTAISPPSYFTSTLASNASVNSGSYLYLNCTSPNNTYRVYQDANPPLDDAADGQLGVLCTNGSLIAPSTWPDVSSCMVVPTCMPPLPAPPALARYNTLPSSAASQVLIGGSFKYICNDTNATVSDGSNLNYLELDCVDDGNNGSKLVLWDNTTVPQSNPTWPTCRSQCRNLYIGNKQYTAANSSGVYRANDTAVFNCPAGFYVGTMNYTNTSVTKRCNEDGNFQTEVSTCFLIPCTNASVLAVTPPEGDFKMLPSSGAYPYLPTDKITFNCNDSRKVPANGMASLTSVCQKGGNFSQLALPTAAYPNRCVFTCSNFPNITGLAPVSTKPVLANYSIEYTCKNKTKIPDNGNRLMIPCNFNGTFQYEEVHFNLAAYNLSYPRCVVGCMTYPAMPGFLPISQSPLLPGDISNYTCATAGYVPHTDQNLTMVCGVNGTLIPDPTQIMPICVKPQTCRLPSFPTNPNYVVNDMTIQYYSFGDSIDMKCKQADLVPEDLNRTWSKTTFSILCAGDPQQPSFQVPPPEDWPRCLPQVCSNADSFDELEDIMDTCICEFSQCTEYIFDNLIEQQCPDAPSGPFCGLVTYDDDYNETMSLFSGNPPSDVPTADELQEMDLMAQDLAAANSAVAGMTTNSSSSSSSNSTSGKRKRRSLDVPLTCADVKSQVDTINGLMDFGNSSMVYPISTIRRYCSYILATDVSYADCASEGLVTALGTSNNAMTTRIANFKAVQVQLVALNQAYSANATAMNALAKAANANSTAALLAYAKRVNFMPYNTSTDAISQLAAAGTLPADLPTAGEVANNTQASSSLDATNAAVATMTGNGTAAAAAGRRRRRRRGVAFSCSQVKDELKQIKDLLDAGSQTKVYQSSAIVQHCDNILQSKVTHDDCQAEGMTQQLASVNADVNNATTVAKSDFRLLKKLSLNQLDGVVATVANARSAFLQDAAKVLQQARPTPIVYNPQDYQVGASEVIGVSGKIPATVPTQEDLAAMANMAAVVANVTASLAAMTNGVKPSATGGNAPSSNVTHPANSTMTTMITPMSPPPQSPPLSPTGTTHNPNDTRPANTSAPPPPMNNTGSPPPPAASNTMNGTAQNSPKPANTTAPPPMNTTGPPPVSNGTTLNPNGTKPSNSSVPPPPTNTTGPPPVMNSTTTHNPNDTRPANTSSPPPPMNTTGPPPVSNGTTLNPNGTRPSNSSVSPPPANATGPPPTNTTGPPTAMNGTTTHNPNVNTSATPPMNVTAPPPVSNGTTLNPNGTRPANSSLSTTLSPPPVNGTKTNGTSTNSTQTGTAATGNNSTGNSTRVKRSVVTTCADLKKNLEEITRLMDYGIENKVYPTAQIVDLGQSILKSTVTLNDCKNEGMEDELKTLGTEVGSQSVAAKKDVELLGKFAQNAITDEVADVAEKRKNALQDVADEIAKEKQFDKQQQQQQQVVTDAVTNMDSTLPMSEQPSISTTMDDLTTTVELLPTDSPTITNTSIDTSMSTSIGSSTSSKADNQIDAITTDQTGSQTDAVTTEQTEMPSDFLTDTPIDYPTNTPVTDDVTDETTDNDATTSDVATLGSTMGSDSPTGISSNSQSVDATTTVATTPNNPTVGSFDYTTDDTTMMDFPTDSPAESQTYGSTTTEMQTDEESTDTTIDFPTEAPAATDPNADTNATEMVESTRKQRSVSLHFLKKRQKRSLSFKCNTTMVYGINVYDIHNQSTFRANRCCCPDFRGELFNLFVTINTPWSNILADSRSSFYQSKETMVSQEVEDLLSNPNVSWVASDNLISYMNFTSFQKTSGNLIGVNFDVLLRRPHWDNNYRLEQSFTTAAGVYYNSTDQTVLGKVVQGKFDKNNYVIDQGTKAVVATAKAFADEDGSGSGDGSGYGSTSTTTKKQNAALVAALVIIAAVILIGIPFIIAFKSKACLCKQCFAK